MSDLERARPAAVVAPPAGGVDVLRFLGLDPRDVRAQAVVAICGRYTATRQRHSPSTTCGSSRTSRPSSSPVRWAMCSSPSRVMYGARSTMTTWRSRGSSPYRRGWSRPVVFPGRYPVVDQRGRRHPYGPEMALKVAEAHALRRAFDVAGLPVAEERDAGTPPPPPPAPPVDMATGEVLTVEDFASRVRGQSHGAAAVEVEAADTDPEVDVEEPLPSGRPRRQPDGRDWSRATDAQLGLLGKLMGDLGVIDRTERLALVADLVGRPVESSKDLTRAEASTLIDQLASPTAAAEADRRRPGGLRQMRAGVVGGRPRMVGSGFCTSCDPGEAHP